MRPGYVEIAQTYLQALHALKARTGLGPNALMRGASDAPSKLDSTIIKGWMDGNAKSARPEYLDYVFKRWTEMPCKEEAFVFIHEKELLDLNTEKTRTGIGSFKLLKQSQDVPDGLSYRIIESWMSGQTVRAQKLHYDFTLELWRSLPDAYSKTRI